MNLSVLKQLNWELAVVDIYLVKLDETEPESERSGNVEFCRKQSASQRWLWHTIERRSGKILVDVFGHRKNEVFLELKALLLPIGISRFYTDNWGAYERHLDSPKHKIGKQNIQKIENKHLKKANTD